MTIIDIAQPIIMMIIIVYIGFIISKRITVTENTKEFISFTIINFAIPSVIIGSIFQTEIDHEMWSNLAIIFGFGLLLSFSGLILGYILGKKSKYSVVESKQMAVLSACGNTSFYGIPIAFMIFGTTAGLYASIYDATTVLTIFTVGIIFLKGGSFTFNDVKNIINAPLITLISCLSLSLVGFIPPYLIMELASLLSSLAAPLAMIYIGFLFKEVSLEKWEKVKKDYGLYIFFTVAIKVLLLPLLAFIVLLISRVDVTIASIIILQAGMPTFLLATILFNRYTKSGDLALFNILLTSLISVITIPLLILVFMEKL